MFFVVAFHHLTIMFMVLLKVWVIVIAIASISISSCWQLDIDLLCCDPLTITTTISVLHHRMGRLSTIASTINCPTLLTRFRQVLSRHSRDPVLILWSGLPSASGPMVFSHHSAGLAFSEKLWQDDENYSYCAATGIIIFFDAALFMPCSCLCSWQIFDEGFRPVCVAFPNHLTR